MGFFDNHNHSQFSFDGKKTTVEESAAAAFAKGLDGICFTDHCDFYVPPMKAQFEHLVPEVFAVEAQQAEIDRVNAASYAALPGNRRFRILKGIEIGLQKKCREQIREQAGRPVLITVAACQYTIFRIICYKKINVLEGALNAALFLSSHIRRT